MISINSTGQKKITNTKWSLIKLSIIYLTNAICIVFHIQYHTTGFNLRDLYISNSLSNFEILYFQPYIFFLFFILFSTFKLSFRLSICV